ncbi:MAG TPA: PH domain-containing protein [Thermoplasmata archaeon]|nr:PH domain-containing protein [Thermoplasmata archaeon]
MSTTTPRKMPKLLKATYMADQEALLEETRATKLFYFPGPILWTVVFGFLALLAAPTLTSAVPTLWSGATTWLTLSNYVSSTVQKYFAYFWLILFLLGLIWLVIRYFRWITTVYAVTSRRVIIQRGILGKDFDEIPVTQVRGVDVRQSFGQRILGFGTVRVSSEGGNRLGNEDWKGIPKPFRFQKLIENAMAAQQTASSPVQWAGPGH